MVDKLRNNPKVLALLGVAVAVLIVGLAITYWPTSPPDMPETVDDVKALLASDKYAKLSKEKKVPYQERSREIMSGADREARRGLMQDENARDEAREMMKQMFLAKAKEFALASPQRRQQLIEEGRNMMKGRRGPGGRPGGGNSDGKPGGQGDQANRPEPSEAEKEERQQRGRERMEEMVNSGNAQEFAMMMEYMRALRGDKKR